LDATNAFAFAWSDYRGTPLNTRLIVGTQGSPIFGDGGANAANTERFRRAFIRALQDATALFGLPFACIAVAENPPAGGPGLHFHVHIHGPTNEVDHAAFRAALARLLHARFRWDSRRTLASYDPVMIKPERLGFLSACATFGYDLKGSEEVFCLAVQWSGLSCPFDRRHFLVIPQGTIFGQRVYISDSLREGKRRTAGFPDRATLADPFQFVRDWRDLLRARLRAWWETRNAAQVSAGASKSLAEGPKAPVEAEPPPSRATATPTSGDRHHHATQAFPCLSPPAGSDRNARSTALHPAEPIARSHKQRDHHEER
jgi:hypothetical protein